MHGWANIDLIMYWKKRESTRVEKIGIQNFDNTLTCDCDIQLGQFPPQLPLEMYLFRYMEFIIGLQKLSNFPHLILYFLIIYIKGPVVVKLQEDSLDFNCELLCVCNFSSNLSHKKNGHSNLALVFSCWLQAAISFLTGRDSCVTLPVIPPLPCKITPSPRSNPQFYNAINMDQWRNWKKWRGDIMSQWVPSVLWYQPPYSNCLYTNKKM